MYLFVNWKKPPQLDLKSRRLINHFIRKLISTYRVQLITEPSNRLIIQLSQNKFLSLITNVYCYVTSEELHLAIKFVSEVISIFATKHEKRLLLHINMEAIQLSEYKEKELRRF